VGRFLADYMKRFRFQSITTEEFLAFLEEKLPGIGREGERRRVAPRAGPPRERPRLPSEKAEALAALAAGWEKGVRPTSEQVAELDRLRDAPLSPEAPAAAPRRGMRRARRGVRPDGKGNYELLVEWLTIAAGSDYEPAFGKIREVLVRVGRMKYLRPLYGALAATERTRALAREIFAAASPTYHGLSRRVVAGLLEKFPA
jgi:Leukotriene A4 hydrolase, C-terminal.